MAEPRVARYTDIVPAKKTVIGSKVVNAKNEDVGKIEDRTSYKACASAKEQSVLNELVLVRLC